MPDLLCTWHVVRIFAFVDKVFGNDAKIRVKIAELVVRKSHFRNVDPVVAVDILKRVFWNKSCCIKICEAGDSLKCIFT